MNSKRKNPILNQLKAKAIDDKIVLEADHALEGRAIGSRALAARRQKILATCLLEAHRLHRSAAHVPAQGIGLNRHLGLDRSPCGTQWPRLSKLHRGTSGQRLLRAGQDLTLECDLADIKPVPQHVENGPCVNEMPPRVVPVESCRIFEVRPRALRSTTRRLTLSSPR